MLAKGIMHRIYIAKGWGSRRRRRFTVDMQEKPRSRRRPPLELMQFPGDALDPTGPAARASYEHEAAALDLSEAAQALAQAACLVRQGRIDELQHLTALASRLYESADRHRELAERLEPLARPGECDDS